MWHLQQYVNTDHGKRDRRTYYKDNADGKCRIEDGNRNDTHLDSRSDSPVMQSRL